MKAWVLDEVGKLNFKEIEKPKLTFGEVLIEVKAAGICGSDIPRAYVNGAHKMPLILGHELSGEVVVAPGPKAHWKGKRVGVFPLIPCMECEPCMKRQYEMCRNYSYLGSRCDGGFSQFVVAPGINLIEIPDNVSYEEAAMLEPMAVAVHAMRKVNLAKGEKIVIAGLGTIGLLLLMFLLIDYDANDIFVIGNKDFQKEQAMRLGISEDNYCDSRCEDMRAWVIGKTAGGANAFFECVGKEETVTLAVDVVRPAGRIMLVGNPHSDMTFARDTYWKILRNQLTVYGTWNSSFTRGEDDDWHYVVNALKEGKVKPASLITHRFALEDINKGFEIMRDKKEDYVKIMMTNM